MPAVSTQLNAFIMPATSARPAPPAGLGLWSRLLTAIHDSSARRMEREIGFLIERRGGRMTDDLEREIERRHIR